MCAVMNGNFFFKSFYTRLKWPKFQYFYWNPYVFLVNVQFNILCGKFLDISDVEFKFVPFDEN